MKLTKMLIVLLAASTLAACTGGGGGEVANPAGVDKGTASTSSEPAELVLFSSSGWTAEAFDDRFGNAIRKKFPQHTIRYIQKTNGQDYQDLLTAGQKIDIVWESVGAFPSTIQYDIHMDMSDLIKKHDVDISKIQPTMLDAMNTMSGGKLYALPVVNNTLSLYYNKDIFDKFGVPYPKDGITWDEVIELNKKLNRTDGATKYVGLAISPGHYFGLSPLSVPVLDPKTLKPIISGDKWRTMFETNIRLSEDSGYQEKVQEINGIPGVNNFAKKQDAAMFAGLANTHVTQDLSAVNWDVVTYPTYKEAPGVHPQSYPTYFGVSNISQHKDQAMEVIKYLVSNEFQLALSKIGTLPVIRDEAVIKEFAQETKFKDKNVKSALYSSFAPIAVGTEYDGLVGTAYMKQLTNLVVGKVDLNTFIRTTEEESIKAIEAAKAAKAAKATKAK